MTTGSGSSSDLSCQRRLASRARRDIRSKLVQSNSRVLPWMPAFAGMTIMVFLLVGCTQNVHFRATKRYSKVVIDDEVIGEVGPEGRDVTLPAKFGPATYNLFDHDTLVGKGYIHRTKINPWSYGLSVGGAMVLSPALAITAALAVNPAWVFASSVFLQGGGTGSFWAYLAQTASFWTFPAVTLGAAIGLLPLVGLLYSERLPDVVLLPHDSLRP